ncbi:hypothetical protein N6B72_17480 [Chryseobacterium soli]|uniref:hypothetical protein n=1 Tax=Chryseobacterium soli TaxID=445961 RepID=UPI002952DCD5|nr:hypothetical protein [Chryseobacterium soli]MDV7698720.1 hypothetical protein [Chryseobacterium soli]
MPTECGKLVCVNHPEQELGSSEIVALPKMVVVDNKLAHSNELFPAKLSFCPVCGYIEFSTIMNHTDYSNEVVQENV